MKQTAVEWLANELFKQLTGEPDKISLKEVLEKAKEMEKQQIVEAYLEGMGHYGDENSTSQAEQYYNEKFKQK